MPSNPLRDPALRKYLLLQIPEAILVVMILAGLHYWETVSLATTIGLGLAWVVKDIIMYPILRPAYEAGPGHGTDMLIGASGLATDELAPKGMVRIGSELWKAHTADAGTIPKGDAVVVEGVDGFTLVVRRDAEEARSDLPPDPPDPPDPPGPPVD